MFHFVSVADKFVEYSLLSAELSCNDSIKVLINKRSMQKFKAVLDALCEDMEAVFTIYTKI